MDKKIIVGGCVSALFICGAFFIGSYQAKAELNDEIVTIKIAEEKYNNLIKNIETSEKMLESLKLDTDNKRNDLEEAKKLIDQKDSLKKEVSTLTSEIDSKTESVESLTLDINNKNKEIERLQKGIVELKSKPIKLPAGDFTVGVDIDAGRYRVTPSGSNTGNFSVNDGRIAGVMLGNDSYSVKEYIVTVLDGDDITQTLPVIFQAVE